MYTGLLIVNLIDTAERAQKALMERVVRQMDKGDFDGGDVQAWFDLEALKERAICASETAKGLS